jgi:hypothetical protein
MNITTSVQQKGKKKVYTIEIAGQELTRSTEKEYTHAVIARAKSNGKWYAENFCGRLDLAEKAKARVESRLFDEILIVKLG